MTSSLNILDTMLHTWTDEEVSQAWSMIAKEGKRRRSDQAARVKKSLTAGDTVEFVSKRGTTVQGEIQRVKYKKAIVSVANSSGKKQNWDVPLGMLTKVS